ncbi:MAG: hypothetical protein EPN69_11335 [Rhodanobacter sp.]|nr:MAG: hypothetical protein EPN69_11335 [Rhodanobacter sp.]TAM01276.1 MAG: hypothetical protein EPN71_05735 [Rhodanobacter sp.]TAM41740.1 MAG: hypothetical protein EPN58_05580 [Rhodanobacter sp.]TAN23349.1 MAG: hypothetical protein EPN32_11680 [Rhodanobacter sp.]
MPDSPLAAATRGRVYQQHARSQPHERGRRVLAMAGTLAVHLFFLFGFVLGPAFKPTLPPPPPELALQVRLIEPSEPPPPPPVRGTPPRERGPRHQGRRSTSAPRTEPRANIEAAVASASPPVPAPALIAQGRPSRAPTPKPMAAPPPPLLRPSLSVPTTIANVATPAAMPSTASEPKPAPTPAGVEAAAPTPNNAATSVVDPASDVSRAPDAIAQGRDDATVGEPAGVATAPPTTAPTSTGTAPASPGAGKSADKQVKLQGAGKSGGEQPGARQGEPHGALGDYVQLKPHGDTEIMRHGAPNIGYQPTRFDKNWTPEGESSIDTALRHAVEKTTVEHIFHLPRGVRVECAVKPLLPIALFGCTNPDSPAAPVSARVYEQLNLAPAKPLAPMPAASRAAAPAPTPMLRFDNSAECAAARVAGGPLPPGCETDSLPARPIHAPASSSSSWVPASDQFQ